MTNSIHQDDYNGFNFDALHKAYETGILQKDDFATDEHWCLALDIFTEQMTEELEIPEVQEMADSYKNPNNWGLSPLRDAALRRQMAQDPNWDAEQLNAPVDPEIDAIIAVHNNAQHNSYPYLVPTGFNRYAINDGSGFLQPYDGDPNDWQGEIHGSYGDIHCEVSGRPATEENNGVFMEDSLDQTEADQQPNIIGADVFDDFSNPPNTRYFGDFQADYQGFDWEHDYVETGFPDGQFLGNGLSVEGSAFLAECWRSHNTDGAYDYIAMIADDDLRERISRIYDTCDGSTLVDRSQIEFCWEQETLADVCDDPYGLGC